MRPFRASSGFRGINGTLPAARVPSIYSTVLLTLFRAYLRFTKQGGQRGVTSGCGCRFDRLGHIGPSARKKRYAGILIATVLCPMRHFVISNCRRILWYATFSGLAHHSRQLGLWNRGQPCKRVQNQPRPNRWLLRWIADQNQPYPGGHMPK